MSCEGNLCNCVRSLKKIQDFNGPEFFVIFLFQAYIAFTTARITDSSLDFISAVLIYDLFHIYLSHYISLSS